MSHTVSDTAQQPRLVVDRYGSMDMVSINFILPKGVLKAVQARDIAFEVEALIAAKGVSNARVTNYHPDGWAPNAE